VPSDIPDLETSSTTATLEASGHALTLIDKLLVPTPLASRMNFGDASTRQLTFLFRLDDEVQLTTGVLSGTIENVPLPPARSILGFGAATDGYIVIYGQRHEREPEIFSKLVNPSTPDLETIDEIAQVQLLGGCIPGLNTNDLYIRSDSTVPSATNVPAANGVTHLLSIAHLTTDVILRVPNDRTYYQTTYLTLKLTCPQQRIDYLKAQLEWVEFENPNEWPNISAMGTMTTTPFVDHSVNMDPMSGAEMIGTGTPQLRGRDYFLRLSGYNNQGYNADPVSCLYEAIVDVGQPTEAYLHRYSFEMGRADAQYVPLGLVTAWLDDPVLRSTDTEPNDPAATEFPNDSMGFVKLARNARLYVRIRTPQNVVTQPSFQFVITTEGLFRSGSIEKPYESELAALTNVVVSTTAQDVSDSVPLELESISILSDRISFHLSRVVPSDVSFTVEVQGLWVPPPTDMTVLNVELVAAEVPYTLLAKTRAFVTSRYAFAQYPGTVPQLASGSAAETTALEAEPPIEDEADFAWPGTFGSMGFASASFVAARQRSVLFWNALGHPPLARALYLSAAPGSIPRDPASGDAGSTFFRPRVQSPTAGESTGLLFHLDFPEDLVPRFYDDTTFWIDMHLPAELVPYSRAHTAWQSGTQALLGIRVHASTYYAIQTVEMEIRDESSDSLPRMSLCADGVSTLLPTDCASALAPSTHVSSRRSTVISFRLPSVTKMVLAGLAADSYSDTGPRPYWKPPIMFIDGASADPVTSWATLTFWIDGSIVSAPSPDLAADLTLGRIVIKTRRSYIPPAPETSEELLPEGWPSAITDPWIEPIILHLPLTRPAAHIGLTHASVVQSFLTSTPVSQFVLSYEGALPISAALTGPGASSMRLDVLTSSTLSLDQERADNAWPPISQPSIDPSTTYAGPGSPYNLTFEIIPGWTNVIQDFALFELDPSLPVPGAWSGTEMVYVSLPEATPGIASCSLLVNCADAMLLRASGITLEVEGKYSIRRTTSDSWQNWVSFSNAQSGLDTSTGPLEVVGTSVNRTVITVPLIQVFKANELVRAALSRNLRMFVTKLKINLFAPLAMQRALVRGLPLWFADSPQTLQAYPMTSSIISSTSGGSEDGPAGAGDTGVAASEVAVYTLDELAMALNMGTLFALPAGANYPESPYDVYSPKYAACVEIFAQRPNHLNTLRGSVQTALGTSADFDLPEEYEGMEEGLLASAVRNVLRTYPIHSSDLERVGTPPAAAATGLDLGLDGAYSGLVLAPLVRTAIPWHVADEATDTASLSRPLRVGIPYPAALRTTRSQYDTFVASRTSPPRSVFTDAEERSVVFPFELAAPPSRFAYSGQRHLLLLAVENEQCIESVDRAELRVTSNGRFTIPSLTAHGQNALLPQQGVAKWPLRVVKRVQEYLVLEIPVELDPSDKPEPVAGFEPQSTEGDDGSTLFWPVLYPGARFELAIFGFDCSASGSPDTNAIVSIVRRDAASWLDPLSGDIPPSAQDSSTSFAGAGVLMYAEAASSWLPVPGFAARSFPKGKTVLQTGATGDATTLELRLKLFNAGGMVWDSQRSLVFMLPVMTSETIAAASSGTHGAALPAYLPGQPVPTQLEANDPLGWCFTDQAYVVSARWHPSSEAVPEGDPNTVDFTESVRLGLFTRAGFESLVNSNSRILMAEETEPMFSITKSNWISTPLPSSQLAMSYFETTNDGTTPFSPVSPSDEWAATSTRLTVAVASLEENPMNPIDFPTGNSYVSIVLKGVCPTPGQRAPRLPVEARLVSIQDPANVAAMLQTTATNRDSQASTGQSLELAYPEAVELTTQVVTRQNLTTPFAASKLRFQLRLAKRFGQGLPRFTTTGLSSSEVLALSQANVVYESSEDLIDVKMSEMRIDLPPSYLPATPPLDLYNLDELDPLPEGQHYVVVKAALVTTEAAESEIDAQDATLSVSEQDAIDRALPGAPAGAVTKSLAQVTRVLTAWSTELSDLVDVVSIIGVAERVFDESSESLEKYTIRVSLDQLQTQSSSLFAKTSLPSGTIIRVELDTVINARVSAISHLLSQQNLLAAKRGVDPQSGEGLPSSSSKDWENWLNYDLPDKSPGANVLPTDPSADKLAVKFVHTATKASLAVASGPMPMVMLHDFVYPKSSMPTESTYIAALDELASQKYSGVSTRETSIVVVYSRTADQEPVAAGGRLDVEILTTLSPLAPATLSSNHAMRGSDALMNNRLPIGTRFEFRLPVLWIASASIYNDAQFTCTLSVNGDEVLFQVDAAGSTNGEWSLTNLDRLTRSYTQFIETAQAAGLVQAVTYLSPPIAQEIDLDLGALWKFTIQSDLAKVPEVDSVRGYATGSVFLRVLLPAVFSNSITTSSVPSGMALVPMFGNNLAAIVPPCRGTVLVGGWSLALSSSFASQAVALTLQFTLDAPVPALSTLVLRANNALVKELMPAVTHGFRFSTVTSAVATVTVGVNEMTALPWIGVQKPSASAEAATPFGESTLQLHVLQTLPSGSLLSITIPGVTTPSHAGTYVMVSGHASLLSLEIRAKNGNYLQLPSKPVSPASLALILAP